MQAINGNNGQRLAKRLSFIDTYVERMRRLAFIDNRRSKGDAQLIRRRVTHTFFQRQPVDVIYLNDANIVVAIEINMGPYKLCRQVKDASSILKVPAGTVVRTGTRIGHKIRYL